MGKLATIDVALDEMLVNLAAIVLRLSKPEMTRTPEARVTSSVFRMPLSLRYEAARALRWAAFPCDWHARYCFRARRGCGPSPA